jgi:transcriptional regulator with XRE-family HTH domain
MKSLRAWRAEQLLSTRRLAALAGTSNKTIVQIENGRQLPSFATIAKICRALGVSPRDVSEFGDALDRRGGKPPAANLPAPDGNRQSIRVVCVSESTAVLVLAQRLLEHERFEVTTLIGAGGTFDYIRRARPDVTIVELEPSRPFGWELLEQLNADPVTGSIPVIIRARDAWLVNPSHVRSAPDQRPSFGQDSDDRELSALVGAVESVVAQPALTA